LTFDLDIQTRPSEGPNTSFMWIWRKSVQRLPTYSISYANKNTDWRCQNRTFRSLHACGNNDLSETLAV